MTSRRYSEITLERFLLGELPENERRCISEDAASDPALRLRIEALRSSSEEILSVYPPAFMKSRIEASLHKIGRSKKRWFGYALLPAGAAAAVFLFVNPTAIHKNDIATTVPVQTTSSAEQTRFKGSDSKLFIYRKTGDAPEALVSGMAVHEGEVLQLAYVSSKIYGIIFSIDGRGSVTLHFPLNEESSTRLEHGTVYLPSSYQLDDAPVFERFFFIASDSPIDVSKMLARARRSAADRTAETLSTIAPEGFSETSVLMKKESAQ